MPTLPRDRRVVATLPFAAALAAFGLDYWLLGPVVRQLPWLDVRLAGALATAVVALLAAGAVRLAFRSARSAVDASHAIEERAWEATKSGWERRWSGLSEDIRSLSDFSSVMSSHLDSANATTEEGSLAIMSGLGSIEGSSRSLIESLQRGEQEAGRIKATQSRRLMGDQEMLRDMEAYVERRARDSNKDGKRIREVLEQVRGLTSLTGLIRDVAKQINLLSLNAAIEATRAGSAGRGFTVVAQEIRQLSRTTHSVTEQIDGAIAGVKREIERNLSQMVDESRTKEEIGRIREISDGLRETMDAFAEVLDFLERISHDSCESLGRIHQGVVDVLGHIQFQDVSRQQIESVKEMIGKIVDHMRSADPGSPEQAASAPGFGGLGALLESHRGAYVMRRQREAHDASLGRSSGIEDLPAIELF